MLWFYSWLGETCGVIHLSFSSMGECIKCLSKCHPWWPSYHYKGLWGSPFRHHFRHILMYYRTCQINTLYYNVIGVTWVEWSFSKAWVSIFEINIICLNCLEGKTWFNQNDITHERIFNYKTTNWLNMGISQFIIINLKHVIISHNLVLFTILYCFHIHDTTKLRLL